MHGLRGEPVVTEQRAPGDRLPDTGIGEPHVHPAGEQALRVPLAFAVPDQHECGHDREPIRPTVRPPARTRGGRLARGVPKRHAAPADTLGTGGAAAWLPLAEYVMRPHGRHWREHVTRPRGRLSGGECPCRDACPDGSRPSAFIPHLSSSRAPATREGSTSTWSRWPSAWLPAAWRWRSSPVRSPC